MAGSVFLEVNERIERERRAKYLGTASIKLTSLHFHKSIEGYAEKQGSGPLTRTFREERGCRQEDSRHHAIAVISQQCFDDALTQASLPAASLLANTLPYPKLDMPSGVQLECLQGQDRVLAADEFMQYLDKRWVVDLFLDDLSQDLRTFFIEDYDFQKIPDDGEFYCKIRGYQGKQGQIHPYFERMWLARLSAVSKNRRTLFDQLSSHQNYSTAFDALLIMPALFGGFKLTVIHELLPAKCDEPCLFYLSQLKKTWETVFNKNINDMKRVSRQTLRVLEGMAPGACSADRQKLDGQMASGEIFENFTVQERKAIWPLLCSVSQNCVLPSLHTFFEDWKFLKKPADCLKRLMYLSPRDTVNSRLDDIFDTSREKCLVQMSETVFSAVPCPLAVRLDVSKRQLWIAAMREYEDIPPEPQKAELLLAKARTSAKEVTLSEFACLAYKFGFESNEINKLRQSPDEQVALQALHTARKPEQYKYIDLQKGLQQIVEIFNTAQEISEKAAHSESLDVSVKPPKRFGLPRTVDHDRDKHHLFFPTLHRPYDTFQNRATSLFIRRSVYFLFFGNETGINISESSLDSFRVKEAVVDTAMEGVEEVTQLNRSRDLSWVVNDQQQKIQELEGKLARLRTEDQKMEEHLSRKKQELAELLIKETAQVNQVKKLNEEEIYYRQKLRDLGREVAKLRTDEEEMRRKIGVLQVEGAALTIRIEALKENEKSQQQLTQAPEGAVASLAQTSQPQDIEIHDTMSTSTGSVEEEFSLADRRESAFSSSSRVTQFENLILLEQSINETGIHPVESTEPVECAEPVNSAESLKLVEFRKLENGKKIESRLEEVDLSSPYEVGRLIAGYRRDGFHLFDQNSQNVSALRYFMHAIKNGTDSIVLVKSHPQRHRPIEQRNNRSGANSVALVKSNPQRPDRPIERRKHTQDRVS